MKFLKHITVLAAFVFVATSCKNNAEPEVKTVELATTTKTETKKLDPNASYAKVEFKIKGMTCAMGCAKTIEKKMAKMDGVKMAKVDFDKELAMVEFDEAKVTPNSLEEAVAKVSDIYKVEEIKKVTEFSTEKKSETKMGCKADCKMACCKDKAEGEKMACAKDCKKDCCKDKKA